MLDRVIRKLPVYHQTDVQKEFFAATFDQLFSPANVEQAQGFIGRRSSGIFNAIEDTYLGEPTKNRAAYQLEPIAYSQDPSTLEDTNKVFYEDLLNHIKFHGGNTGNHDRLFADQFYSFAPPIDADKYLNYQNYVWLAEGMPIIYIQSSNPSATNFDNIIETYIIGKEQFNTSEVPSLTPTNLQLSSGMRVRFEGSASYDTPLYIEGVGRKIKLVEELSTLLPGGAQTLIPWDPASGPGHEWDATNWDATSLASLIDRDYLTIERGSCEGSPWTRTNRWFHIDVINTTQDLGQVLGATIINGGIGYSVGDVLEVEGDGIGGRLTVTQVDGLGSIVSVRVSGRGQGYSIASVDDTGAQPSAGFVSWDETPPGTGTVWDSTFAWDQPNIPNSGTDAIIEIELATATNKSLRGRRPILEFQSDLQLYNFGQKYIGEIDLVAEIGTLQDIVGETSYTIDGINVEDGMLIIFLNPSSIPTFLKWDESPAGGPTSGTYWDVGAFDVSGVSGAVTRFVWKVTRVGGVFELTKYDMETGVASGNAPAVDLGDVVLVRRGTKFTGSSFYQAEVETSSGPTFKWVEGQGKEDINEAPLFSLVDYRGIPLDDSLEYPNSTFAGNEIFSYRILTQDDIDETGGTLENDPILGFPLTFRGLGQVSDIVFENDLETSRYTSGPIGSVKTEIPGYYFYKKYDTDNDCNILSTDYETNWLTSTSFEKQRLIDRFLTASDTENQFVISATPVNKDVYVEIGGRRLSDEEFIYNEKNNTVRLLNPPSREEIQSGNGITVNYNFFGTNKPNQSDIYLFVNGVFQDSVQQLPGESIAEALAREPKAEYVILLDSNDEEPSVYAVSFRNAPENRAIIRAKYQTSGAPGIDTVVDVFTYTHDVIDDTDLGYFEIPAGLENNPNNLEITENSWNEFANHFVSIIENQNPFKGSAFGVDNNYRDSKKDGSLGTFILQNQSPLLKAMFVTSNEQLDLVDAMRFSSREYTRYKNKIIKIAGQLINEGFTPFNAGDEIPVNQWLDECIRRIVRSREFTKAFEDTYMLAWSNIYEEELLQGNGINTDFVVTNFIDLEDKRNAMYVYIDSELQLLDRDYSITNLNPIRIEFTSPPLISDVIRIRLYEDVSPAHIPATPSKLGVRPVFQPKIVTDNTYRTPTDVLVGHDGSKTPLYGDYRDDILFEFEKRIYNGIIDKFRVDYEIPLNLTNVRPGKFRTTRWNGTEYESIIKQSFFKWSATNKADYRVNEFYDPNDEWTWNYSEVRDRDGELLPGYWRGIFNYYYDTQTPATTPWEMLGFKDEPDWWAFATDDGDGWSGYGNGPWPASSLMWRDLEEGRIRRGARKGIDERYARPGIASFRNVSLEIANAGTGYALGDILTISGGSVSTTNIGEPTRIRVDSIGSPGNFIQEFTILDIGYYSISPPTTASVTGGSGTGATFNTRYATYNPVNSFGQLKDTPLKVIDSLGDLDKPTAQQASAEWEYGDNSPVEYAWRISESFPYSASEALFLTRPAEFGEKMWDPEHAFVLPVKESQIVSDENGLYKRVGNQNLRVHGESVSGERLVQTGYQVWISCRLRTLGRDIKRDFGDRIRSLDVKLGHKMASFTDKDTLRVFVEGLSVGSDANNLLIPNENIDVALHTGAPVREYFYGGVLVRSTSTGSYRVYGYDILKGEFNYIPRKNSFEDRNINVGGQPEKFSNFEPGRIYEKGVVTRLNGIFYRCLKTHDANRFIADNWRKLSSLPITGGVNVTYKPQGTGEVLVLPYGAELDGPQEVFDFLVSYGQYLESQGWVFENVNTQNGTIENWLQAGKEFLFWVATNWEPNSLIMLSPSARGTELEVQEGYPASVEKIINGVYSILDKNGVVIDPINTNVRRADRNIKVEPLLEGQGIYALRVNSAETESTITFDNITDFNDVIYDPLLGTRQDRLFFNGRRTLDWTGKLEAAGYIITEDGLLQNFENLIDSPRYYHDTETIIDNPQAEDAARHLIGFVERDYFDNLELFDDAQYQFYQGMIRQKGTKQSIEKLERNKLVTDTDEELVIFEEWALKLGEFNGTCNKQLTEYLIRANEIKVDPQLIQLSYPSSKDVGGTGSVSSIDIVSATNIWEVPPAIIFQNHPDDTVGSGASAISILDSDGRLSRIDIIDGGSGYTVPPYVYIGSTTLTNSSDRAVAILEYEIDSDIVGDDVILIDVDDHDRWITKPNGIACDVADSLWPSTELETYETPNAGYVHLSDIDYTVFNVEDLQSLWTLPTTPESGDTIWTARSENEKWAVYQIVDTVSTLTRQFNLSDTGSVSNLYPGVNYESGLVQLDVQIPESPGTLEYLRNTILIDGVVYEYEARTGGPYPAGPWLYVLSVNGTPIEDEVFNGPDGVANFPIQAFYNLRFRTLTERNVSDILAITPAPSLYWVDNNSLATENIDAGWAVGSVASGAFGPVTRSQTSLIDTQKFENAFVYDSETKDTAARLPVYDPFKGLIPGIADLNIRYKTYRDPARYNNSNDESLLSDYLFGSKNVGELWWDLSTCAYLYYEQGTNTYRRDNWGALFPGSNIDIYEWTRSVEPPSEYDGDGTPKNETDYVQVEEWDPLLEEIRTFYYFWVKNRTEEPEIKSRTLSASEVARTIRNPRAQGYQWFGPISQTGFMFSGIEGIFTDSDNIFQINFKRLDVDNPKQVEWELAREGDTSYIVNPDIWDKMVDSIVGFTNPVPIGNSTGDPLFPSLDNFNNALLTASDPTKGYLIVPDPALNEHNKYGIKRRPLQSMFRNLQSARKIFVQKINELVSNIILRDEDPNWNASMTTNNLWEWVDWYATGFTAEDIVPTRQVSTVGGLNLVNNAFQNEIVKVNLTRPSYYQYDAGTDQFRLIARERSRLQLKEEIYTNNPNLPDALEIRELISALKDNVFKGTREVYNNLLFFAMLNYVFKEQEDVDWVFKTTYVFLEQTGQELRQQRVFQPDPFESALDYILEVKPYQTKIRDYKVTRATQIDPVPGTAEEERIMSIKLYYDRFRCDLSIPEVRIAKREGLINASYDGYSLLDGGTTRVDLGAAGRFVLQQRDLLDKIVDVDSDAYDDYVPSNVYWDTLGWDTAPWEGNAPTNQEEIEAVAEINQRLIEEFKCDFEGLFLQNTEFTGYPVLIGFDISAQGTGYIVGDLLQLSAGGGTPLSPAQFVVTSVGGGGEITGLDIVNSGSYIVIPTADPVDLLGGTGTGASLTNLDFQSGDTQPWDSMPWDNIGWDSNEDDEAITSLEGSNSGTFADIPAEEEFIADGITREFDLTTTVPDYFMFVIVTDNVTGNIIEARRNIDYFFISGRVVFIDAPGAGDIVGVYTYIEAGDLINPQVHEGISEEMVPLDPRENLVIVADTIDPADGTTEYSFRIHYDTTRGVTYLRNANTARTTTTAAVGYTDTAIAVGDYSVLEEAPTTFESPNVAWICNERIEFYGVDTANNILLNVKRGTKGTPLSTHNSDCKVFAGGPSQEVPDPEIFWVDSQTANLYNGTNGQWRDNGDGFVYFRDTTNNAYSVNVTVDDILVVSGTDVDGKYNIFDLIPADQLSIVTITNAGTGYSIGDTVTVSGDGSGATAEVAAVGVNGEVVLIQITNRGTGYSTASLDLTGSGDGLATATVVVGEALILTLPSPIYIPAGRKVEEDSITWQADSDRVDGLSDATTTPAVFITGTPGDALPCCTGGGGGGGGGGTTCGALTSWNMTQTGLQPSTTGFAYNGRASAISDDGLRIFVGGPFELSVDTAGTPAGGAASVYSDTAGTFGSFDTFSGDDLTAGDEFGADDLNLISSHAIAINTGGTFSAVGATKYLYGDGGGAAGTVYTFTESGGNFTQQQQILPPSFLNAGYGERFGTSVALRGDGTAGSYLFVGSPEEFFDEVSFDQPGYVHMYENVAGTWTHVTRMDSGEFPSEQSGYGRNMAISRDGDTLVIATDYRSNTFNETVFYVYRWNGGTSQMDLYATLTPGGGDSELNTGLSVSDDGSRIVTGINGRVQVWDDAGGGSFTSTQLSPGVSAPSYGHSCSICGTGEVIYVTDPFVTNGDGSVGRIDVWKEITSVWTAQTTITSPDGVGEQGWFGWAVSANQDGTVAVVTSPNTPNAFTESFGQLHIIRGT